MKNKKFFLGILVMTLVFGMTVVGCDDNAENNNGNGGGGGSGNSITITGITGKTGEATIYVVSNFTNESGIVAAGLGNVSGNTVTFSLVNANEAPWTGSGSYYLMLGFDQDDSEYYYTNGQTITAENNAEFYANLPKYNISSAASTIAFNLFREISIDDDDGDGDGDDERPTLTGTVTIDETSPQVGDTLTAAYSDGNGTGTATWQWILGESTNIGTNNATYIVVEDDWGQTIKAQVSFADQSDSVISTATAVVQGGELSSTKWTQLLQAIQADASFGGTLDLSGYTRTANSTGVLNSSGYFDPSGGSVGKDKIKNIILPDAAVSIESIVFSSLSSFTVLESVTGANITAIGATTFLANTTLKSVVFPNVTSITNDAFSDCTALETAQFATLGSIGTTVFKNCAKLKTIDFSEATSIGANAFEGCVGLTGTVTFPKVLTIGGSAFLGCTNLDRASFPLAINVGSSAFEDCDKLARVDLPSATMIGANAFNGAGKQFQNTSFSSSPSFDVYLGKNPPNLGTYLFGNTSSTGARNVKVYVPNDADMTIYAPSSHDDGSVSGTDSSDVWVNGFRGAGWNGSNVITASFRNSNVYIRMYYAR
jgi:hypothetical protein